LNVEVSVAMAVDDVERADAGLIVNKLLTLLSHIDCILAYMLEVNMQQISATLR